MHDDVERWRDVVVAIAARYSSDPVTPTDAGTVLVGLVGASIVVKLYPPFLRDHRDFEAAMLERLHGRLQVPTPALLDRVEYEGWPGLVMTQLAGVPLEQVWPTLAESARCDALASIGRLAAEVHALPVSDVAALAPLWRDFVQKQRAGCGSRQQRTGLPAHLLAQLPDFLEGELPSGPPVLLTGEYTPMNLLHAEGLAGMFDFGDGLVGPAPYDWLGPLCFLAAGHRERCDAFLSGYGASTDRAWRLPLLRMLLLHRYSHLKAQIAWEGWTKARSFGELAEIIWP